MRLFSITISILTLLVICAPDLPGQWVRTGPYGGQQKHLASGNGIVLTGSDDGIYRSTDNGSTWYSANNGLTAKYIDALAFIGMDFYAASNGRVYLSADGGLNWNGLGPVGSSYPYVTCFAATPTSLFAGTMSNGVYKSTDGGNSWTSASSGLPKLTSLVALVSMGTELYVTTWSDSVWRSTDDGTSWHSASGGIAGYDIHCIAVSGTTLIGGGNGYGIYRSVDHGASWQLAADLLGLSVATLGAQGSIVLAGADDGIYRSTDLGTNWVHVDTTTAVNDVAFSGTFGFVAADEGVRRSTDNGTTWRESNAGIANLYVTLTSHAGTILAGGVQHGAVPCGVFRSTDDGITWTHGSQGLVDSYGSGQWVTEFATLGTNVYCSTISRGVYRSTDDGTSWIQSSSGLLDNYGNGQIATIVSKGSSLFAGGQHGVSVSTDQGATWNRYNDGLADTNISVLAACGTHLFASAWSGAYVRNEGDAAWTALTMPTFGIPIIGSSGSTIVAGYPGGTVYRSTDFGTTWIPIASSEGCSTMLSVSSPSGVGRVAFGGTYYGVYRSTDEGVTFSEVNNGWDSPEVTSLAANNDFLFAATYGEGVWKLSLTEATGVSPMQGETPSGFALLQNYPNPFNPETGIRYQTSGVSWIRLVVYDILGREVAVLVDEKQPAGTHEVRFDGSGLSSGVYFYRLTAGGSTAVRTMTLIK